MARFLALLLAVGLAASAAEPREMGLLPEAQGDRMGWENPGDVPQLPDDGELVVQKVRPADCRVVLGFVHSPVDGRPDSWGYNGVVQEYDDSQGYAVGHWQNVTYEFLNDPGLYVTLADGAGFNYLVLRGGFHGFIYQDVDALEGPGKGKLIREVSASTGPKGPDHFRFARIAFPEPVKARQLSFFRKDGLLTDASFLRVGAAAPPVAYAGSADYRLGPPLTSLGALGPDFARLTTENPKEQHPSNFERRFPRAEDRAARSLVVGGASERIELAPNQPLHLFTPRLPAGTPVGAIRLDLDLQGAGKGNLVALAVQDPLIGNQELMRIDVRMGRSPRVRCLLDFPDQLVPEGGRFWVTLASQRGGTLGPTSKLSLLSVAPEAARAEHLAWRLFLLKGYFYVLSEARPWTGKPFSVKWLTEYDGKEWSIQRLRPQLLDLYRTVEHLRDIAPDHPIAVGQYYRWLTRGGQQAPDPKEAAPAPSVPGVPRWAPLLAHAAREVTEIPNWWLTHRMAPNGELGGFLGDDTDMLQWWVPSALLDSETFAPKAREAFRRIARLVLAHNLKDGVNRTTTDALHAYEEGQNHMSVMPLLFYGHPHHVEWLMASARTTEKWMHRTPDGKLRFRVNDFGWDTAQKPSPTPAAEVSSNAHLLLHPHLMLAWYSRHPHALATIKDYIDGQGGGLLGGAYGAGASLSFAAYWFTADPRYLGLPPGGRDPRGNWWARFQPDLAVHAREARQQPWWKDYHREISKAATLGDWAWATGQDRDTLCKALDFALHGNPASRGGGAARFRYIWTEAEMFTDRIFLPIGDVAQPMLGGYTARNKLWPAYAVSYEGLGSDFAALVLEQGRDRLKLALANLRDEPRAGAFRVWQLDHGRYQLSVGPDADDDGTLDRVERTETLTLKRMDAVPVRLPPRKLVLYELRQVEKLDDLFARPDLALCDEDIRRAGDRLQVTVHNLGNAAVKSFAVALLDAAGKLLATAAGKELEAPTDLLPRTTTIDLPFRAGAARVALDPDDAIPEIAESNNSAIVPPPAER